MDENEETDSISFGLKIFAGVCTWKQIEDDEKTITCSELTGGGVVEYGILNLIKEEVKKEPKTIIVDGIKYLEVM